MPSRLPVSTICVGAPSWKMSNPFKHQSAPPKIYRVSRPRVCRVRRTTKWSKKTKDALSSLTVRCVCGGDTSGDCSDAEGTDMSVSDFSNTVMSTMTGSRLSQTSTSLSGHVKAKAKIPRRWSRSNRYIISPDELAKLADVLTPPKPVPVAANSDLAGVEEKEEPRTRCATPDRTSWSLDAYIRPLSPPPRRKRRVASPTVLSDTEE
ncbi:hypothetical protein CYLTODRAFT_446781 [Cylindrobasidium torrendii FP15055 ss-10]|uniref:Uncharacterized protein n=1 Tax=Cylindrobasidium torrendii FP15055 ss-10 TaxID=1314674 RepID=A0A0D7AXQ8_9AGAR|nr:hypothetical protein CYLTODRAFT_446781 [Cylindrobasidium torrendii FP15055 ss-10]